MELGILIIIIGIAAIVYMFIAAELEHRKKHPKGVSKRNECCNCKYFQKNEALYSEHAHSFSSPSNLGILLATDGRRKEGSMKIRLALKILKHQPENDPIGRKFNGYWVKRWEEHERFPPSKRDHRIEKAISLTDPFIVNNKYKTTER